MASAPSRAKRFGVADCETISSGAPAPVRMERSSAKAAMSVKTLFCSRHSTKLAGLT
jgi:hypothetical protein